MHVIRSSTKAQQLKDRDRERGIEITFEVGDGVEIGDDEGQVSVEVCVDEDDVGVVTARRRHFHSLTRCLRWLSP